MEHRRLQFVWSFYKGCRISAMAIYDPGSREWIPKAHTYWKRGHEKHLGTLTDSERFETSVAAQNHALSLAHQWCDENLPELIPSPRED
jgi:hypothetical protein